MRKLLVAGAAAALLLVAVGGAQAATLVLHGGEGWQIGQDNVRNAVQATPTTIQLDVTNPGGDDFSFTDGFLVGDIYSITFKEGPFSETVKSLFTSFPTTFDNNLGDAADFAAPWLSPDYSHFQAQLGDGTYTVTVKDTSNISFPAHFGFRLDAVPEPATWAMMMLGVGLIGLGLRTSRKSEGALTTA